MHGSLSRWKRPSSQPFSLGILPPVTMPPRSKRDAYKNAIDKVRSEHSGTVNRASYTVECPRCRTRQVITDTPGMRVCVKCGFEFQRVLGR